MLYIGTKQQEKEYRENPAINQSTLKQLQDGLIAFKELQNKDKEASYLTMGSMVDCILLGEQGDFDNIYYVSPLETYPSEVEQKIVTTLFETLQHIDNPEDLVYYGELLIPIIDEIGWQPKWKMETRVNKITQNPNCQEYFKTLFASKKKTIVSTADFNKAMEVVQSLSENPCTRHLFDRVALEEDSNKIVFYQLPLYFNYKGEECKALLDIAILHLNEEKIIDTIEIIDLKTMWGETLDFPKQASKYRYDIQIAWYLLAINKSKNSIGNKDIIKGIDKNCKYKYAFVVESTNSTGCPLIYEVSDTFIKRGKKGAKGLQFKNRVLLPILKGYEELMEEYIYYANNEFQEDIRLKDTEGRLLLT